MRRRDILRLLGGAAVSWPVGARAQQSKKVPRLCFLTFDPGTLQATRFAFFEGLRDLGYVDGQSINIDYLSADGRGERFPALAAECLRRKADIIAVSTTPAAQAAKNATRTKPIIIIALGDPVAPLYVKALKNGAPSLGVTLQIQDGRTGDDLPAAFEAGAKEHAEGLLTTAESMFAIHRAQV